MPTSFRPYLLDLKLDPQIQNLCERDGTFRLVPFDGDADVAKLSILKDNGKFALPAPRKELLTFKSLAFYTLPIERHLRETIAALLAPLAEEGGSQKSFAIDA